MDYTEKKLRRVNRYEGIVVDLTVDRVLLPDGKEYRYAVGAHLIEAPAGKLERGEDPDKAVVRELSEETGFTAGRLIPLGRYYSSPGISTEKLHLYLALRLRRGEAHPDEGEFLDLVRIPYDELYDRALNGEIPDAKTAVIVLQARRFL